MRWRDVGKLDCTIARTLSVIGDRWTLLVLRDAFQASLGITRHRLADRLRKLVGHGVLRRERYQASPPRFEYRLTEKGHDLYGVIVTIAGWGDKHMAGKQGPPVERVHRGCGHVTALRLTCDHCGDVVTARDMTARPTKRYRDTTTRSTSDRRSKERA